AERVDAPGQEIFDTVLFPVCPTRRHPCSPSFASAAILPRYPARAREWHLRHGGRLPCQRHEILGLEIVQMRLSARARDGLRLKRQHRKIIRKPTPRRNRIESPHQFRVLRGDAGWIAAFMPIVVRASRRAELAV